MSRKFGKFLLFSAVAGAAAYSAYYFLKSKEGTPSPEKEADGDDDFDDFSEDLDDDAAMTKERSYVSLNLDRAEAIASEAFHKAKEVIADSVQQVKDTVKSVTESQASHETSFTDLTALNRENENAQAPAEETGSAQGTSPENNSGEPAPNENAESAASKETPGEAGSAPAGTADGTVEEFFDDDKN